MAKADILLSAGIKFNPRDVDTKAIKTAVVKALSTTRININKLNLGRDARTALQAAIGRTNFRIEKASFGRSGLTALRQQFRQNEFRIDKVAFTNRALNSLNSQLKKTPFEIATAQPARGTGVTGAARDATREQTQAVQSFNQVAAEQRANFLKTTRDLEGLIVSTTQAERSQRNYLQSIAQGSVSLEGFGANIVKITQRFSAYLVSIKAILVAQQAFSASLEFIFTFDDALQNLAKVVDTTETSLTQLGEGLFQVANQTGNAVTSVAEATGQFVRQGLTVPEALERSRAALIGVNAANIAVSDSTKLVTVALRVFGDEITDAVDALDILNSTADNAATNQEQIVQAILRSGSAAKTVGLSFGELNAIIAATVEQTQLSGNQIGSALKTIFARLATNTSGLREQANALGANIQPGETFITTLQKLADVFPNLTRDQQAQLVTLAAGKRRFTEFAAVLQQFQRDADGVTRIQELLNVQLDGAGNTAAKNEAELAKLSTRAQQAANAFSEFVGALAGVGEGGGIAGGIGTILDSLTTIGTNLTEGIRSAKALGNEFISLFSVLQNIAKAGFFVIAPTIIKQIITGAKTFLGIGQNISRTLNQLAQTQAGFNAQLQQGSSVAETEAQALSRSTNELRQQLQLRQAINNIGVTGVQTGGVGAQAQRLQEIRGQGQAARTEGRFRSFFRSVDQLKDRGIDSLRRGFASLENRVGPLAARLAVTTVALQGLETLGPVTERFADTLERTGNTAAASTARATQSAAEVGVQIGLLAGPVAGVVAGVTALVTELTKSTVEIINNTLAAEQAATAAGSLNVALGQVERTASEDLIRAFKDIADAARSDDPEERSRALVSANTFVIRGLQALASESSSLNSAFKRSGEVLTETVTQVAQALRAARLDQVVQEAVGQIQREATAQQQVAGGGGTRGFNQIRDLNAEIAGLVSGQTEGLLTQEQVLARITQQAVARSLLEKSGAEQNELRVQAADELLRRTGNESDALRNLRVERERITASLEEQTAELRSQLDAAGAGLDTIKRLNNALKQAGESQANAEKFATAGRVAIEASVQSEQERARILRVVEGGLKNIENSFKEQAKLTEQINTFAQQESQQLDDIVAKIRIQATQADLALNTTEQEVSALRRSNEERQRGVDSSAALLRQQLNSNSFSERQSVIQARITQQQQEAVRQSREKLDVDIQSLQVAREQAQAAGQTGVVEQLETAIRRARELRREQSEEIRQQFSIELSAELQRDAFQDLQRAEQSLRDFRVRQIEDVVRKEQDAVQRRVALIERLGQTAAGRGLLQEETRGRPGDIRDFGAVTASILRTFEESGERTINALNARVEQLRVNGVNTFEELRQLKDQEKDINAEIAALVSQQAAGVDVGRDLAVARQELARVGEELEQITDRGISNTQELNEVTNALGEARTIREENLQRRREAALARVEQASDRVNSAEAQLVAARNQVPASNQRIIQSQRALAQAEERVEQATQGLLSANQQLADANFRLALDIGLAEVRARQAAGGFSSIQQAIDGLGTAFQNAVRESRGSFEEILQARREVLQEEVTLVQGQLQALRGLSQQAFSADPGQLQQLQQATQIAGGIQAGDLGAQDLLELPPELRQALSGLTSAFPALQAAIDEVGAGLLGFDPGVFQTLEQQLVELQTGIAETGQIQVQQGEQQVRAAQGQLEEARQQRELALQQLENSVAQKEALLANVSIASQNVSVARAGFNQQATRTGQLLAQSRRSADSTAKTEAGINALEARQSELLGSIQQDVDIASRILGINQTTQPAIEQTKTATQQTAERTAQNVVATTAVRDTVAEVGGAILRSFNDLASFLRRAPSISNIGNNATGSLTNSEINGLLRAASAEKRAMPAGSRLMLANTSETVLTRNQARKIGLSSRPVPNAQNGNAVVDGTAFEAIATQLTNLNNRLQDISSRAAQPQNVTVQVDSSRTVQVQGLNDLQASLQDIITDRLGATPSQVEVDAINEIVFEILQRMRESGNENFQNI